MSILERTMGREKPTKADIPSARYLMRTILLENLFFLFASFNNSEAHRKIMITAASNNTADANCNANGGFILNFRELLGLTFDSRSRKTMARLTTSDAPTTALHGCNELQSSMSIS
mmetsp:Transcript_17637/g.36783  ORF Transcript_17637/g.36783 Transcript_17637/m.36783 type:complete len:116 (-) Transcript_17637:403-750(-)